MRTTARPAHQTGPVPGGAPRPDQSWVSSSLMRSFRRLRCWIVTRSGEGRVISCSIWRWRVACLIWRALVCDDSMQQLLCSVARAGIAVFAARVARAKTARQTPRGCEDPGGITPGLAQEGSNGNRGLPPQISPTQNRNHADAIVIETHYAYLAKRICNGWLAGPYRFPPSVPDSRVGVGQCERR